jgi:hypothetical protein
MPNHPFATLPPTPAVHFKLYFYAAVLRLIEHVTRALGTFAATVEQFPFLTGYSDELAAHGVNGLTLDGAARWWCDALSAWEETVPGHLPLRALRAATDLDYAALTMWVSIGLSEEDARFGVLFATTQGTPGQHRPTVGLLNTLWSDVTEPVEVRTTLRRLQECGVLHVLNPETPRAEWILQLPSILWDAIRGDAVDRVAPWAHYHQPARLTALDDLVLPEPLYRQLAQVPALLTSGDVQTLIVRGPQHNGRHTVLGAVARQLGYGMLALDGLSKANDERWRLVGPLATLLNALPVVAFDLAPEETAMLPGLDGYNGPLGIVLGRQGGVQGPGTERALTLGLNMPDVQTRSRHWRAGFGVHVVSEMAAISERFRMTSGYIRRAAHLAMSYAALDGRITSTLADVQQASRALNRQMLDTLATPVPTTGSWDQLAVSAQTFAELANLESRCRHRERIPTAVGAALRAQLNVGVRTLFCGPSGTGKTLAARLLASMLQMDLYRVDLSTVVNKYIGETEKNLNQLFSCAEDLDVILLLDEGDALLTQRTRVQTSNDRYANLETNYLLQRLEAFEGILIVTTNASESIDSAFQRRIDVVVHFRPPEAAERWSIWQLHLPTHHTIDDALLREVAGRCALTGGQIRNAVLHASTLALDDGQVITSAHLEAAVQREYRKAGAVCPLRRPAIQSCNQR